MTDTDIKLSVIEEKLASQLRKSRFSLRITAILYLVIVIFVIAYTSYVTKKFKALATPDTIAELLIMRVEQSIPLITNYLIDNSEVLAESFAIQTVDYGRSMVPSLGLLIRGQIDVFVTQINEDFSNKYLPIIDAYFSENKADIMHNINSLSDEKAAELLATSLTDQVDFGILTAGSKFNAGMVEFKQELDYLASTPNDKLTRKELAHKRAIGYWMYLVKHAEIGKLKF